VNKNVNNILESTNIIQMNKFNGIRNYIIYINYIRKKKIVKKFYRKFIKQWCSKWNN